MVTTVNIDNLIPKQLQELQEDALASGTRSASDAVVRVRATARTNLGFKVQHLYDWRRLERLTHRAGAELKAWQLSYWDNASVISEFAKTAGAAEAWLMPTDDSEYVDVVHRRSVDGRVYVGRHHVSDLVKDATRDLNSSRIIVKGDDLRRHRRCHERSGAWMTRYCTLSAGFHYAVESRLQTFVEDQLLDLSHEPHRDRFIEGYFQLENEGRSYLLRSDKYGHFDWLGGRVFSAV